MRYCMNFQNETRILNKVDEINIKYNRNNTHILEFLEAHQGQIINICLENAEAVELFINNNEVHNLSYIKSQYPILQFKVRLFTYNKNQELFNKLKENNIPVFINTYINSWDMLTTYLQLGVSDIYIVNEMGFDLKAIKSVAGDTNIRVFPHIAQSSSEAFTDIKAFFIRPEDIDLYSAVVDVCEFIDVEKTVDTYYQIYAEKKKWFGRLNEIILGLKSDLDSRYIVPAFGRQRIKCSKKCLKGGRCATCDRVEQLSHTLADRNLIVMRKEN